MKQKNKKFYVDIPTRKKDNIIDKLFKEVAENRTKIIDDFLKTYVASRLDWFKEKPERIRRIKLIEQRSNDGLTLTYWIEMMPGKNRAKK